MEDTARIVSAYIKRLAIARFHHVLETGCDVELGQLMSLESLDLVIT
jgi:hypothetical protein